jgi:SHS2 domain-containing protein
VTTRTFEILEHTADVGIEAVGPTCEEAFAATAEGLATLLDAWAPGEGEGRQVRVQASDLGSALVGWLDELLYLHEAEYVVFGAFDVRRVDDGELEAEVRTAPAAGREAAGTSIKAATFHRLHVGRDPEGTCRTRVYLDV